MQLWENGREKVKAKAKNAVPRSVRFRVHLRP